MTTPILSENVKGKGRHYRTEAGDLLPSVTNIQGALSKPALPRWAAKVVAEQAWEMRSVLDGLGRDEAVDMLKGAPWRNANRAAGRGDDIHFALEQAAWGRPIPKLEGQSAKFRAGMQQFLADHTLKPLWTEVTLFGDGYAGTADFVGELDGVMVLMDYKTGKGLYREVGLQVSALASCHAAAVDGHLLSLPDIKACVAVVIKEDGYDIRQVADVAANMEAFRALLRVWHWQNGDDPLAKWHASTAEGGATVETDGSREAQPSGEA